MRPPADRYEREADRLADLLTGQTGAVEAQSARAVRRARAGDRPLPAAVRAPMEQVLGAGLDGVRVHTDATADLLSRSLHAAAFTTGKDIFFRREPYPVDGRSAFRLLAHELVHVAQQRTMTPTTVQRHFDPPPMPSQHVVKPTNPYGLVPKAPHPSKTPGWAISKNVVPAQELLVPNGVRHGHKVTRFTALLTPGHAHLYTGVATRQGYDPIGWAWVEQNEVRTRKGRLRFWIRFHLLNAKLGGKGTRERHLVPTDKSANARWDRGIERPMAAALKGATATPVYYDVSLTYWNRGDAPDSYVDATTGADYKDNITLFPESITGEWKRFQQGRWVDQPALTVTVDKPRGISGDTWELMTHPNLKRLGEQLHVDEAILARVKLRAARVAPTTYAQVRNTLEIWAMEGTNAHWIHQRQEKIFASDGYLRDALDGATSFKLTINGQPVPDDATPEAKRFDAPVDIRTFSDLDYEEVAGPIAQAYMSAHQAHGRFPPLEDFLWLLIHQAHLYGVTMDAVQQRWDSFEAANTSLPPMSDSHLVPDEHEVLVVLQRRTQQQVVTHLRDSYRAQIRGVAGTQAPLTLADGLVADVDTHYAALLAARFGAITVQDVNDIPRLARSLLLAPAVRPLAAELDARLTAAPDMVTLGIAGNLPQHPFAVPLTDPMAALMQQLIATERRQRPVVQQPAQPAPPPPAQQPPRQPPPPARRTPPGSPRRHPVPLTRTPTSPIRKAKPQVHEYNQRVITAVKVAVRADRRYTANQAARADLDRRTTEVLKAWKRPTRTQGKASLQDDVDHALTYVFRHH